MPILKKIFRELKPFLVFIVLLVVFRTVVADWGPVPTGSMEPNIYPGDVVWIDKTAYGPSLPFSDKRILAWGSPDRGDVVTFTHARKRYVKRVIGVPGDTIRIVGNDITINGHHLPRSIVETTDQLTIGVENIFGKKHAFKIDDQKIIPHFGRTITVPADKLFVIGDFRNNSVDSRHYGFIGQDRVTGKVSGVALSFSVERGITPLGSAGPALMVAIPVR